MAVDASVETLGKRKQPLGLGVVNWWIKTNLHRKKIFNEKYFNVLLAKDEKLISLEM